MGSRFGKLTLGYPLVILATAGWGMSGLFLTFIMRETGISALSLAFWRDLTTFACLFIGIAVLRPALLRVDKRDLKWLAGLGFFSIGIFHIFWNLSITINGVGVATVLQEAAPAFVAIVAYFAWRESIGRRKVIAILVTFAGCMLVAGIEAVSQASFTLTGALIGLMSAITYGTFTLFGKQVTKQYSPWTILMYGFGFATIVLLPMQFLSPGRYPLLTPAAGYFVGLILIPTIAAFGIYTVGLRYLSASVAAILGTAEVVFASLFAYVFLAERLTLLQIAGAALVVGGVVLLSLPARKPGRSAAETVPPASLPLGSE